MKRRDFLKWVGMASTAPVMAKAAEKLPEEITQDICTSSACNGCVVKDVP